MTTIGIIGLGNMGSIVAQIVAAHHDEPVLLANRTHETAEMLAQVCDGHAVSADTVFSQADVIFLGVKPTQLDALLRQHVVRLTNRPSLLFISMAAGVTLTQLQQMIPPHHRWIRMMPNTPLAVDEGVVSYAMGDNAITQDSHLFEHLFQDSGKVVQLPEKQLDAATAVAGCGPAFVYLFIEALADAGVQQGLTRDLALTLASQTVKGAATMVLDENTHPAILKDQVCSPGGSTIAGVASLEETGLRSSVIQAVDRAMMRTRELGQG